jgi:putative endonuclease
MYYIYILYNLDNASKKKFYVGFTTDLNKRLNEHRDGKGQFTKRFGPWRLVYFEAYLSVRDAIDRERKLKHHGKGLSELKKRIEHSVHDIKKVRDDGTLGIRSG